MKKSGYKNSKRQAHQDNGLPFVSHTLINSYNQLPPAQESEIMLQATAGQIEYVNRVKASDKSLSTDEFNRKWLEIFAGTADSFINKIQKIGGR